MACGRPCETLFGPAHNSPRFTPPALIHLPNWSRPSNAPYKTRGTAYLAAMDPLTAYGLFAVSAMLVCYALESRSPWWTLAFAFSCLLGSSHGFLQRAWPFGVIEGVWAAIAARKW